MADSQFLSAVVRLIDRAMLALERRVLHWYHRAATE